MVTELRVYTGDGLLQAKDLPDIGNSAADAPYRPASYADMSAAIAALDAPTDANYVPWTFGNTDLETVFASLSDNDILVLPERPEPYLINSSNGFMAAGVKEIDGTDATGKKDGSRIPIVSNSRLWFSMTRARRGIIGLGPGVIIEPSASSFSQGKQPILQNEPAGQQFQLRYMTDGSSAQMVGAAMKLMESAVANPFFANFTIRGRDFGGVAYSALSMDGTGKKTIKRVYFDGASRGHEGVPNAETGGISILNGTYLIENCDFRSQSGTSPVMWNRTKGGQVRNARSTRPDYGMWTFWKSGGLNTFENVWMVCNRTGLNLEENDADFELDWANGKMQLESTSNKFHFGINPSGGSIKIRLHNVECSPNGWTPNAVCMNVYSTSGVQRRADVSSDGLPVSHLPSAYWIN